MIKLMCYLYNSKNKLNGYRGENLTDYVLQGVEDTEDLTQELDTTEITLMGIKRKNSYEPSTKFIIDITEDGNIIKTLHRVVKDDFVTQPILNDDAYFKHEISLIEPSVIAQKHTVDNIACTYKLKDVSLDTKVEFDLSQQAILTNNAKGEYVTNILYQNKADAISFGKYFAWSGNAVFLNNLSNEISTTYIKETEFDNNKGYIKLPSLQIHHSIENEVGCAYIGDASFIYTITVTQYGKTIDTIKGSIISNSNLNSSGILNYLGDVGNYPNYYKDYYNTHLLENLSVGYFVDKDYEIAMAYLFQYTDTTKPYPNYNIEVPVGSDYEYNIKLELKILNKTFVPETLDDPKIDYRQKKYLIDNTPYPTWYFLLEVVSIFGATERTIYNLPDENFIASTYYYVYKDSEIQQVIASGQPYSALLFIQKAIMNSTLSRKVPFTYAGNINYFGININEYPTFDGYVYNSLFYIDNNYIDELAKTNVIENFYNQKNLWEILIEVGYYIHAIPEIKFGDANKLMITFNRLGETTETNGTATPIMITNFRGIDDYIAESNSYISNMVQLGGQIEEVVAPKSSSEDYLVYNDVAEIQVSRPIIELISLKVKPNYKITWKPTTIPDNDGYYDMTQYIYEQNVYKILSINYNDNPNKGIAMYYNLRDNKIIGGNYQLPQASDNIYSDYTFKKVIYCAITGDYPVVPTNPKPASGYWTDIQINNFTFKVTYRTQDSVRQTHTRPDIRKYLVNDFAYFHAYPQWQQFANQEDIVVDSEKYGSNMYGKLIRTGNNNYQMQEWVDSPTKLKQKGEIKKINNEIYYVANIKNTFYVDKIESIVTYSKDYNQLSKVIGIPSEPRFYEISEQSMIKREVAINDYFLITTEGSQLTSLQYTADAVAVKYLTDLTRLEYIIFGTSNVNYSKYAITTFKGDSDIGSYYTTYGEPSLYIDIISSINAYASGNTLTYSWKMVDNFSAGDKVGKIKDFIDDQKETAYNSLQAVQYTDKYGKATLFDFYIVSDLDNITTENIKALPSSFIDTTSTETMSGLDIVASNVYKTKLDTHKRGLVLLKDSREQICFNYNLQAITSSDTFVTSPFLFQIKNSKAQIVLLDKEVNKLSNGYFNTANVIGNTTYDIDGHITYQTVTNAFGKRVKTRFTLHFDKLLVNVDKSILSNVKAIALTYDYKEENLLGKNKFIIAQNLPTPGDIKSWHFGKPSIEQLFKNKQ